MATSPQVKQIKHISPEPHYPKMVIHTTASHGLYYLFTVIDGAIWLLSQDRSLSEVDIILHPVSLSARLRLLLKNARKFLATNFARVKTETTSQNRDEVLSLYQRVYEVRERVTLETSLGSISIYLDPKPFAGNILRWFRCFLQAIHAWKQCHINGYLVPQNLLSLRYREVLIGDLIASTVLRSNPKSGGSLSACSKLPLFRTLLTGIFISDYIWHDIGGNLANHCVIIPEPTYVHAIYNRVLHHRGARVLDPHHYATDFKLIEPNEPLQNPRIAQKLRNIHLSAFDRARAITYLNERIYAPHKHLWYMFQGYNRTDNQLINTEDKRIKILTDKLYAVIFLHSFDDGQYWYGVDGFDDIYHWTIFTIDNLLVNPNIEKVFVKQHPNVDYASYPGDKIAYEKLAHRYASQLKLDWLRKDCSPISLSTGCFVGITHHGSIAEELTFVGIPVIASTFAPWGKAYKFVQTWDNLHDYESLLQSLAVETWARPSEAMIEELYNYVVDYRLDAFPMHQKLACMKYGKFLDGEISQINSVEFWSYEKKMSELACDDPKLINFLNYLVLEKQRKYRHSEIM